MITPDYVKTFARYNAWQNQSVYAAASTLNDEDRKLDRGAFFGSIHSTLCHLLWGDQIWMSRFAGTPEPVVSSIDDSKNLVGGWDELLSQREKFDEIIIKWSQTVTDAFLKSELSWFSGALGKNVTRPTAMLVAHMFNHQAHHRGQVNTLLTQINVDLDDTDLFVLNERFPI